MKDSTNEELGKRTSDAAIEEMKLYKMKCDRGVPVEEDSPTLYPKLLTKYDKNKSRTTPPEITTGFYDKQSVVLNPIKDKLIGCRCSAMGDIVIDNIYIGGGRFSVQVKINDAIIVDRFIKTKKISYESEDEEK